MKYNVYFFCVFYVILFYKDGDNMLTDIHCHIYKEYYDNIDEIIKKSESVGVNRFINNACNLESSKEVLDLCKKYKNMYCVLGLHPEENLEDIDKVLELIKSNLSNKKMIGIGEIGLDYYWNKENKEMQKEVFIKQLKFAEENNLPIVIHSRESTGDILEILKGFKLKGIIHCFNGSIEVAKEYIKMGYKLGINGVVTFKNCKLINVLREIGIKNVVFETDSPYLTPVPDRGKRNEPSYVNKVVEFISNELGVSKEELIKVSNKNISDIFDI